VNRENKPRSRRQCGEIGIEPNRRGTLYARSTATYPSPRRAMERAREGEEGALCYYEFRKCARGNLNRSFSKASTNISLRVGF